MGGKTGTLWLAGEGRVGKGRTSQGQDGVTNEVVGICFDIVCDKITVFIEAVLEGESVKWFYYGS